ncbi:BolA family transcriptional regulator [Bdellovibrio sp. qaytius]|nr:BolA family transcriptional regulator [Bdellovibrio sp. qaytius]
MNREERIKAILKQLNPLVLELKNDSAKHANHVEHLGSAGFTGETHYKAKIVSEVFEGLSRVDRQRKVYDLLKEEFTSGLHAFELKTLTPKEHNV